MQVSKSIRARIARFLDPASYFAIDHVAGDIKRLGFCDHRRLDSFVNAEAAQLRFLLSQAPMIDAPTDRFNAGRAVTNFAYIHPKTLAKVAGGDCTIRHSTPYVILPPSSTKWVSTSLMPEGRVIYTPNSLPGLTKILASELARI
jgi:hypothetical protein